MEGDNPAYVEAVAVKDGIILQTGALSQLNRLKGENTTEHNLEGQTLLPGFIEPHLHPLLATILIQTEIIAFNDWSLPHGEFRGVRDEESYFEKLDAAVAIMTIRQNRLLPGVFINYITVRSTGQTWTSDMVINPLFYGNILFMKS